MKKFGVKILFSLLLLPLVWGVGIIVIYEVVPYSFRKNIQNNKTSYGYMQKRISEAKKSTKKEVLVLGSSHAYRGFDNRNFSKEGIEMFNLGSSSQTPIQSNLLSEVFLENLSPELVIIEVYPATLSLDGLESMLDLLPKLEFSKALSKVCFQINHPKIYNHLFVNWFESFADRFNLRKLSKKGLDGIKTMNNGEYISGGFVSTKKIAAMNITKYPKRKFEIVGYQCLALEKMVENFKYKDIEVVFVFAPVSKSHYNEIGNLSEFEAFYNSFDEVNYYDFNKILNLENKYFYDAHHLTQEGVDKFNTALLNHIVELQKFKD